MTPLVDNSKKSIGVSAKILETCFLAEERHAIREQSFHDLLPSDASAG